MMSKDLVVDVSKHDGVIDWKKVKESGVSGAIIRCGYGSDKEKYDDPKYLYNVNEALNNGIKIGVYLYSYAKDKAGAASEAEHALRLIIPFKDVIKLPVYYDVEEPGTEKGVKDRCVIFCDRIEAAGFIPGVYANIDWWKEYLSGLEQYTKWIAKWSEPKPTDPKMELWQFDAYGTIPGIGKGSVDLDRAFGKVKEILESEDPEPTPEPEPEVIEVNVKTLKRKSDGSAMVDPNVLVFQSMMNTFGIRDDSGSELKLDSHYGKRSEQCCRRFQSKNGLKVDGICGPATWDKIANG